MSKIGKFWLFGKQDEPAEDFDMDYDNIYYEDTPAAEKNDTEDTPSDKMPLFGAGGYNGAYGADMSDVKVVSESPADEPEEETLYKVVFAPEAYRDCGEMVESFKLGRVVVIETDGLAREDFIRMMDYVMGAVHALDGELVRLDGAVALFPAEVDSDIDIDEIEDEPEDYFDGEENDGEYNEEYGESDEDISEE